MERYIAKSDSVALISDKVPLLRDLNIVENIALILEYHENRSIEKANKIALSLLKRYGIDNLANKKVYEIDKVDNIIIKYIRAYVSNFDTIVIDRPFSMLDSLEELDIVFGLNKILDKKTIEIVDLKSNDYYKDKNVIQ